jgi:TolA-binding protein
MSSPKARRRQRSTRLSIAVALVIIAADAVFSAVLAGSWGLLAAASLLGIALCAVAVRITHSELMQARRDHNRDRAAQAQGYAELTSTRTTEHTAYATGMEQRLSGHQTTIEELEVALTSAQKRAAEAARKVTAESRRAEQAEAEGESLARRLDEAETRAAEAILRVAELEAELDVARAELASWQTASRHVG